MTVTDVVCVRNFMICVRLCDSSELISLNPHLPYPLHVKVSSASYPLHVKVSSASYPLHVKVGSSAGHQVAPPDIVSGHQVSPL